MTGYYPVGIVAGDFTGDGIPDLVATSAEPTQSLTLLVGNGDGTFQPEIQFDGGGACVWVASGDLNGDGKLDLVDANRYLGTISVLLGNAMAHSRLLSITAWVQGQST